MTDFLTVTELAGDQVSAEQVQRLCDRYYWAGQYCAGRDVLEAACGTGQGLGYLAQLARRLVAGDFSGEILAIARAHYGDRIAMSRFDAQEMPFPDDSLDVVILFEAIYYLPGAERFVNECGRVLRDGGQVLIATANKDLYDFNPSPYSYKYYGVVELNELFTRHGFTVEFFGNTPVTALSWRQKILRPVKRLAVRAGLMPRTAGGKRIFKRLVFGRLVQMPAEIEEGMAPYSEPARLDPALPDRVHKVIYLTATKGDQKGTSR